MHYITNDLLSVYFTMHRFKDTYKKISRVSDNVNLLLKKQKLRIKRFSLKIMTRFHSNNNRKASVIIKILINNWEIRYRRVKRTRNTRYDFIEVTRKSYIRIFIVRFERELERKVQNAVRRLLKGGKRVWQQDDRNYLAIGENRESDSRIMSAGRNNEANESWFFKS